MTLTTRYFLFFFDSRAPWYCLFCLFPCLPGIIKTTSLSEQDTEPVFCLKKPRRMKALRFVVFRHYPNLVRVVCLQIMVNVIFIFLHKRYTLIVKIMFFQK